MSANVDVDKLAKLARLDLTEKQRENLGPQVIEILDFVEKLAELDTEGVEPMTSALDVNNRFRDDDVVDGLSPETATQAAPNSEEGFFLVPPVLGVAATK